MLTTSIFPLVQGAYREEFGARDRFWKHQQRNRTIKIKGVEQYQNIERCLQKNKAKENIDEESKENANVQYAHKKIVNRLLDSLTGGVMLVEIKDAIKPGHAAPIKTWLCVFEIIYQA